MKITKGKVSVVSLLIIISCIAYQLDGFIHLWQGMSMLLGGQGAEIVRVSTLSGVNFLGELLASISISTLIGVSVMWVVIKLIGEHNNHHFRDLLKQNGRMFFKFSFGAFCEELIFRWFFLGFLYGMTFLHNTIGFYLLLIVSSLIFAIVHLQNYPESKDRNMLRVLPQFLSGLFDAYIFVKYGLFASFLGHLAHNAIIFAGFASQKYEARNLIAVGYQFVIAVCFYFLMSQPITDMVSWLSYGPIALEGWELNDYIFASIFFSFTLNAFGGLLDFDSGSIKKDVSSTPAWLIIVVVVLVLALTYFLMIEAYNLSGYFVDDPLLRVMMCTVAFKFLSDSVSLNDLSGEFFFGTPKAFVYYCILLAIGVKSMLWLVGFQILLELPIIYYKKQLRTQNAQFQRVNLIA